MGWWVVVWPNWKGFNVVAARRERLTTWPRCVSGSVHHQVHTMDHPGVAQVVVVLAAVLDQVHRGLLGASPPSPAVGSGTYKPFQLRISHFLGPVTTPITTPVFSVSVPVSVIFALHQSMLPLYHQFFWRHCHKRMPSRNDEKGGDGMSISASSMTLISGFSSPVKPNTRAREAGVRRSDCQLGYVRSSEGSR